MSFKYFILDSFSRGSQKCVNYTDFEKAFNIVDHNLRISKLDKISFANILLSWIVFFIS